MDKLIGASERGAIYDATLYGVAVRKERFVCSKRSRALRKRGEFVMYCGETKNGEARYKWLMCVPLNKYYKSV